MIAGYRVNADNVHLVRMGFTCTILVRNEFPLEGFLKFFIVYTVDDRYVKILDACNGTGTNIFCVYWGYRIAYVDSDSRFKQL